MIKVLKENERNLKNSKQKMTDYVQGNLDKTQLISHQKE